MGRSPLHSQQSQGVADCQLKCVRVHLIFVQKCGLERIEIRCDILPLTPGDYHDRDALALVPELPQNLSVAQDRQHPVQDHQGEFFCPQLGQCFRSVDGKIEFQLPLIRPGLSHVQYGQLLIHRIVVHNQHPEGFFVPGDCTGPDFLMVFQKIISPAKRTRGDARTGGTA